MNNFFSDFLYKKNQVQILENAYSGVFDLLNSQIQEASRNHIVSKLLTYKRIRFQKIEVTEAMYTANTLLNNTNLLLALGISADTPFSRKLEIWEGLSPSKKAELLDVAGYSILLTSFMHMMSDNESMAKKFTIVDFELTDMSNTPFVRNVDYIFYDNKLFLLREFSTDDSYRKKYLLLKDIVIDTNTTEDVLGVPLNIPFSNEFTKTDYNETLKSFIQAAAGGPTINKLEVALSKYKALEGVSVYDKFNAPLEKQNFWSQTEETVGELTRFDFLVSLPATFLYKPQKLEYIESFFKQIKPAHTNFIFSPELKIKDILHLKYMKNYIRISGSNHFRDKLNGKTTIKGSTVKPKKVDKLNYKDSDFSIAQVFLKSDSLNLNKIPSVINKGVCLVSRDNLPYVDKKSHLLRLSFYEPRLYVVGSNPSRNDDWICDDGTFVDQLLINDSEVISSARSRFMDYLRLRSESTRIDMVSNHADILPKSDIAMSFMETKTSDSISIKSETKNLCTNSKIEDSINASDKSILLNSTNWYDKISIEDEQLDTKSSIKTTDKVYCYKTSNVIVCDSVFNVDSEDIEGFVLDVNPQVDEYSPNKICDTIGMRLIPKN